MRNKNAAKRGRPPKQKFGLSPEDIELMAVAPAAAPKVFNPLEKMPKFRPLNKNQELLQKTILSKEITIALGSAGSGKTYAALAVCLGMIKDKEGNFETVSLCKSVVPIKEEELGFLPGDITEKLTPFMYSFTGNVNKILRIKDGNTLLMKENIIEWTPIAYLRGCQYDQRLVIIDEAQNISMDVFKTIITRLGKSSKIILLGDTEQIDKKNRKDSCLTIIAELFKDSPHVGVVEFTEDAECIRNPIITDILNTLRENNY